MRLLAAEGALAPRASEQLAILVLLLEIRIRKSARSPTQRSIGFPSKRCRDFLGRADVPIGLREFFADRGVFPAEIPTIVADDPLIEAADEDEDASAMRTRIERASTSGSPRWGSRRA